jgi:hypothetical protein
LKGLLARADERGARFLTGRSIIVTTQRYAKISDDMVRREVERVGIVGGASG